MKYVIRYTDGAYEFKEGSGHPCTLPEARRFDSGEEAKKHADMLCDVDCIETVEE